MARHAKSLPPKTRPNRNALCPCGSGRAFKHCCARKWAATPDKPDSLRNQARRVALVLTMFAVIGTLLALAVHRPWQADRPGQPFEYDSNRDRYWSPEEGRWLEGRPPYQPWEYDPTRHKHWHPGDADWRAGRPPPPDQR